MNNPAPGKTRTSTFLNVREIAIIGMSETRSFSSRTYESLLHNGFRGGIHFVNPGRSSVFGRECFAAVGNIPGTVDLAIVSVPAERALRCVDECITAGVGLIIINTGSMAAAAFDKLRLRARDTGTRILGPNTLGAILPDAGYGPVHAIPLEMDTHAGNANIAVIAQSGGLAALVSATLARRSVGTRYFLHSGNEADITLAECIELVVEDPAVRVIGVIVEQVRDMRRFGHACAMARNRGVRVAAVKLGQSPAGAEATASHTGAIASVAGLYDKFLNQAGVLMCKSTDDLVEVMQLTSFGYRHKGRAVAVISASGGACALLADNCHDAGVPLAVIGPSAQASLLQVFPSTGPSNPLDLPVTDPVIIEQALHSIATEPDVGSVIYFTAMLANHAEQLSAVAERCALQHGRFLYLVGEAGEQSKQFAQRQIQALTHASRAVRNVMLMNDWDRIEHSAAHLDWGSAQLDCAGFESLKPALDEHAAQKHEVLTETEGKQLLHAAGFSIPPGRVVSGAEEAEVAAESLGYPLVAKISSRHVLHKARVGGVILNLHSAQGVRAAVAGLQRQHGSGTQVLIEKMVASGVEFLLSARVDPVFGPIVVIGKGGTNVEQSPDFSVRLAPVDILAARGMLLELTMSLPATAELLCTLIARMSELITCHSEKLSEIEVNPLIVDMAGNSAVVVDSVVRYASFGGPAP